MLKEWNPEDITVIEEHPNLLSSLDLPDYNVKVRIVYNGNPVRILMYWNDELLFDWPEFRPAGHEYVNMETMVDALGFICVTPDYGCDITDNYTDKQLKWCSSNDRENLNLLVSDYEDNDSEYHNDALIDLNAGFWHC